MLSDPKHPRSQRIFRASHLLSNVLEAFKLSTRATGEPRKAAEQAAIAALVELRALSKAHFGKKKSRVVGTFLDALEAKVLVATNATVEPGRLPGQCLQCGGPLKALSEFEPEPICLACTGVAMKEFHLLWDKFGTWEI